MLYSRTLFILYSLLFFKFYLFFWLHWVFVAARGLSLVAVSRGYSFVAVRGLLIVVASLCCGAQALGMRASVVTALGLSICGSWALECRLSSCGTRAFSCSTACGIFPDQGSNPCPLHWQVDS